MKSELQDIIDSFEYGSRIGWEIVKAEKNGSTWNLTIVKKEKTDEDKESAQS